MLNRVVDYDDDAQFCKTVLAAGRLSASLDLNKLLRQGQSSGALDLQFKVARSRTRWRGMGHDAEAEAGSGKIILTMR